MAITVYTLPGCKPCAALKAWMHRQGLPFTEKSVKAERTHLREFKEYGARSFPLTIIGIEGQTLRYEGNTARVKEAALTMKKDFSL